MTEAYVTLATTDGYGVGALVLGHSLLSHGTTRQLCILVTPGVSEQVRSALSQVYHNVVLVDVMDSGDSAHLALLERPELGITFTKLHCWTLTQYTKCVFLDADTLALQNTDELFTQPELSAACDVGWPDCFNSGMFVFVPSQETYEQLLDFAKTKGSFDGGDQGLLNSFFPNWHRLSFVYNMVATACYTYLPAFKEFGRNVKLVHFLGSTKPWHGESAAQPGSAYGSFVGAWWTIYRELVRPSMPQSEAKFDPTDAPPQQQEQFPAQRSTSGGHLEVNLSASSSHSSAHSGALSDAHSDAHSGARSGAHSDAHSGLTSSAQGISPCDDANHLSRTFDSHSHHQQQISHRQQDDSEIESNIDVLHVHKQTSEHNQDPDITRSEHHSEHHTEHATSPIDCYVAPVNDKAKHQHAYDDVRSMISNLIPTAVQSFDPVRTRDNAPHAAHGINKTGSQPSSGDGGLPAPSVSHGKSPSELVEHFSKLSTNENLVEGRQRWEAGRPEYMGRDSFDNIMAYIQSRINK